MEQIKSFLYFPIASYFKFFAAVRLKRWHPKIVVVTGSSGKTTLLHLLESQIGEKAKYSHHANSSFGIPFDILDLHRKSLLPSEWIELFLKAPFAVFKKLPKENLYVVEADCDRPNEGKFLAELLLPDIVLWLNVSRTHSMNFDYLVAKKQFVTVDEAIAYEYGYFLEYCSDTAVINADLNLEKKQTKRTKANVIEISKKVYLDAYTISQEKTLFEIKKQKYSFNSLLPEEMFYSIVMCKEAVTSLTLSFDNVFSQFNLPPGRSSLFKGIKNTAIIDSSYNANLASIEAILTMFAKFPAKTKWVVIGDMLELGKEEKKEHEELAEILSNMKLAKIILFGPSTSRYTAEKLQDLGYDIKKIISFLSLSDLNKFIQTQIEGGEAILFKGSQSMLLEGVIEKLLQNPKDQKKLPRREQFWDEQRRKKIGSL
jgi:UDP-N-acetylmuramoyl-tripeptide--D-alanyl-D-alanine ligase